MQQINQPTRNCVPVVPGDVLRLTVMRKCGGFSSHALPVLVLSSHSSLPCLSQYLRHVFKTLGFEDENPDLNINQSLLPYAVKYSYLLREKSSNLNYKLKFSDRSFLIKNYNESSFSG